MSRALAIVVVPSSESHPIDSLFADQGLPINLECPGCSHEVRIARSDAVSEDHGSELRWQPVEQRNIFVHLLYVHDSGFSEIWRLFEMIRRDSSLCRVQPDVDLLLRRHCVDIERLVVDRGFDSLIVSAMMTSGLKRKRTPGTFACLKRI